MTLLLDAGAFVAVERANREVVALIKAERLTGRLPLSHGGVVGQVWRGGPRQANVARLLAGTEIVAVDEGLGRRAGVLLGRAASSDVVDAAIVVLARDGDVILTSDTSDLHRLAVEAGVHVDLVPI